MSSSRDTSFLANTVQDADSSINETGVTLLVAQYALVIAGLHAIVLALFVPFEGMRFFITFMTLVPAVLFGIYTLFFGTRSQTRTKIVFILSLIFLVLAVIELVLRTIQIRNDGFLTMSALLDIILWFITLLYVVLGVFWALTSFRLSQLASIRAERNDDEMFSQQSFTSRSQSKISNSTTESVIRRRALRQTSQAPIGRSSLGVVIQSSNNLNEITNLSEV